VPRLLVSALRVVRRQGHNPADACDLTQTFFAQLLEKNYLGSIQQGRGRFRYFLLTALKHFLTDEWDRVRAQKRGGGQKIVSLDDGRCVQGAYGWGAILPV